MLGELDVAVDDEVQSICGAPRDFTDAHERLGRFLGVSGFGNGSSNSTSGTSHSIKSDPWAMGDGDPGSWRFCMTGGSRRRAEG